MNLSRKEAIILAAALAVTVLGVWAAEVGAVWFAAVAPMALILGVTVLQLISLRRLALREDRLERMEAKLDALSRRVITESEALSRDLGGQFDALAAELRDQR